MAAETTAQTLQAGGQTIGVKKVLVVFYSRTGNTKKVAEDLARQLGADIEQLVDKKDRSGIGGYLKAGRDATKEMLTDIEPLKKNPSSYDLVIIGTPVWGWTMTPAVRTFITGNKDALKEVAFFTTAGGSKPDRIVAKMEALSGKKAVATAGFFAGEINSKKTAKYDEKMAAFIAVLK
jgi:flavodoxin